MNDLKTLTRKLRKVFRAPPPNDRLALQDRYEAALVHVSDFLRPTDEDVSNQFLDFACAIGELRYGIVANYLRPAKVGGRGPDGIAKWIPRASVVTGLECILKSQKMTREDAAKYIAKKYPVFHQLKRKLDASLVASILSWRDRIKAGKVPDALADQRWFFRQHNSNHLTPSQMFALGEEVLAKAAKKTINVPF